MRRLHGLDALRGIAALVVVFHHLLMISGHRGIPYLPFLAVDMFFVISGFIMARTYEQRLRDGSLTALKFVALRYRRLFLPLAIGTTLGLAWYLDGNRLSVNYVAAYVLELAFLPAFWAANAFMFNVPAWSLFLEIIANALHGSIFARMSSRTLAAMLAVGALSSGALLLLGYSRWDEGFWPIASCLPRELSFYIAGILIFRRYGDAPGTFVSGQWAVWLGALSYPLYATHLPVIHLAAMMGASPTMALIVALAFAWLVTLTIERSNRAAHHSKVIAHGTARHSGRVRASDVVSVADQRRIEGQLVRLNELG